MKKKYLKIPVQIKEVNKDNYTLEAVFSADNVDRHGEKVYQNFDLKNFKNNPVLLNSHDYSDATQVIGKITPISVKDGVLQGKIKFAVSENPKAKVIFDLYAGGFLNAFSIGFIPLEFDDNNDITKSELLEVSAVSVPANAMALAKAKGIDVDGLDDNDVEECKHESYTKTEKGFKCACCQEEVEIEEKKAKKEGDPCVMPDGEEGELRKNADGDLVCMLKKKPKKSIDIEAPKKNFKLEALKRIADRKELKRKELLNEVLAVTRRLSKGEVDAENRRQMANRVIRQMAKLKNIN